MPKTYQFIESLVTAVKSHTLKIKAFISYPKRHWDAFQLPFVLTICTINGIIANLLGLPVWISSLILAPFIEEYYFTKFIWKFLFGLIETFCFGSPTYFHHACFYYVGEYGFVLHFLHNFLCIIASSRPGSFIFYIKVSFDFIIMFVMSYRLYVDFICWVLKPSSKPTELKPTLIYTESSEVVSGKRFDFANFVRRIDTSVSVIDFGSLKELFSTVMVDINDDMSNFMLSTLSLIYRLYRLQDLTDLGFAAMDFMKSVFGVDYVTSSAKLIFDFIKANIVCLYNKLLIQKPKTESSVLEVLKDLKSSFHIILNSEIVSSIRDFVLSLVTFKIFDKDVSRKIISSLGPAKPVSALDMAEVCLSSAISVLNFSEQLAAGSSLTEIFCSKDPVANFTSVAEELNCMKELTYSGLPVDGKVCRREFLARVHNCVRDGQAIVESMPRNAPQLKSLNQSLKTVRLIKSNFVNMMSAESREMPYAVCLEGMPGVGKGLLVDYVSMVWSNAKGRIFDQTHVYHRQATEEYWSGYEPASKPIIHYSEPGSLNRNIAKSRGDPVMSEFLSVCDNQPYQCNMADVDSKGKVYALPEFIVMDCNDPSMNLDVLVNNPAAVRRRILYITPTVKPEFKQEGSCRMDQAASLASETPKLDRWTFSVYSLEPQNTKSSNTIIHLKEADIYTLTAFLKEAFVCHIDQQSQRCNILKDEKIENYLSRPTTESNEVERHSSGPRPFPSLERELHEPFLHTFYCITFFECFLESFYLLLICIYWSFLTFLMCFGFGISWFMPQNFFLKIAALYSLRNRINFYSNRADFWWNLFKASLGLRNTYCAAAQPDYSVVKYIAAFSGLLILMKGYRSVKFFTEGSVLSTSEERTEEQVDAAIARIETLSQSQRPPPRQKRGHGIDWDSVPKTIPVPIDHQNLKKSSEEIENTITRNLRYSHIKGKKTIETRILGVCEDFGIVNRHSLSHSDGGFWKITISMDSDLKVGVIKCTIDENEIAQIFGDLFVVRIRGAKFKDITSYFSAGLVTPMVYGNRGRIGGSDVMVKATKFISAQDPNWGVVSVEAPLTYKWDNHGRGLCGTPLLMEYSGARGIVGIHTAGSDVSQCFSTSICKPDLLKALSTLSARSCSLGVNSEGFIRLPLSVDGIGSIHDRSPLNFEPVSGLSVYGGLIGYTAMKLGKSKLLSSDFVHYAKELTDVSPFDKTGAPLFGAPPFTAGWNKETGEYQGPYNHFVKKAGVIKKSLNPKILRRTIEVVKNHVVSSLNAQGVRSIRPVSMEVAQNGDPEDFYMRAMRPSTSGGWPWPGAKKKYSRQCCLAFKQDAYMPLFDVREQVLEQCNAYERHEDALPLLGAQLKDEPRPWKKIRDRKTRVFCMSPYESTLVNRMYLMPFYSLMVEFGDIFRTAIGINMHSRDVDDLVTRMTGFSSKFMEGDYGGFDTSMPYDIGLAANTVVYQVCESLGYDDYALNMVKGILSDNLYPTVVMRGDVFAAPALQPSGKYATAEDNSLRGLILLVYAWIASCTSEGQQFAGLPVTAKFSPEDFFVKTLPVIYGDDVLVGVKPDAEKYFNNNVYQQFCADHYGLEYTNALKTSDMDDFLAWNQVSFLKRNFVFREDLDHWVAPLDKASIMKSIVYYLPSKAVSVEDQLIDSCVSALRELFFHDDEATYERRRIRFAEVIHEIFDREVADVLRLFPRFDSIRESLYGSDAESLL